LQARGVRAQELKPIASQHFHWIDA
jgi:hypothetical protein